MVALYTLYNHYCVTGRYHVRVFRGQSGDACWGFCHVMEICHTSESQEGQIFMPRVNPAVVVQRDLPLPGVPKFKQLLHQHTALP